MSYAGGQGRWDSTTMSLVLGHLFGIRIRVQIFVIIFMVWILLDGLSAGGVNRGAFADRVTIMGLIFLFILLHEFGHCFGCRAVGGYADDILMWPLGGLAFCDPPNRPREHFITTAAGPAVNFSLAALALIPILVAGKESLGPLFNPLNLIVPPVFGQKDWWLALAVVTFKLNWFMGLFNVLLPIFPLDGGRMLQEALWTRMDRTRSTQIAATVGFYGSILLCGVSLWHHQLLLLAIFLFTLLESRKMLIELEQAKALGEDELGYDFSQGYTSLERNQPTVQSREKPPSLKSRFHSWLRKRREEQDAKLDAELDRILAKISERGMESLTRGEKQLLTDASRKRRKG